MLVFSEQAPDCSDIGIQGRVSQNRTKCDVKRWLIFVGGDIQLQDIIDEE
jgi:hypothetical protein|tara:strand:+ start:1498 stop:1647 length:150 start_codon:yes stop_codon:yes gene_type:complete